MNLTVHTIELDLSILNYQVEHQSKSNYYKILEDILFAQVFSTTYHVNKSKVPMLSIWKIIYIDSQDKWELGFPSLPWIIHISR